MTIKVGGGGGIPELAPDLTFPSDTQNGLKTTKSVTGIDASSGLTTVLSATGKFILRHLIFTELTNADTMTFKMTIDGEVIMNDVGFSQSGTTLSIISPALTTDGPNEEYVVNDSILVEMQTTTDTGFNMSYLLRPIK